MKKLILLLIALFAGLIHAPAAEAAVSPLAVTIFPPVQFPPSDFGVTGLRLGLIGRQRSFYGLDFAALGNITDQEYVGLSASGLFNVTNGVSKILFLQLAGAANIANQKMDVYGLQLAGGLNMLNAESKVVGLQLALLGNLAAHTKVYGAQVGLYNQAESVYGLQIGLVNVTNSLHGVQIGLINFNHTGTFAVSPILNVGF